MLGNGSIKLLILKAHFTSYHSTYAHYDHMSLLDKRARFRAAGTLPILGFVSEDKLALKVFYRIAWSIAKEKLAWRIAKKKFIQLENLSSHALWTCLNLCVERN